MKRYVEKELEKNAIGSLEDLENKTFRLSVWWITQFRNRLSCLGVTILGNYNYMNW